MGKCCFSFFCVSYSIVGGVKMAYQRAYFPMDILNITQGYGSSSSTHKLSYALDFNGDSTKIEKVYAPFDCKITKLYQPKDTVRHANTVWLTSTKKVLCPNGYYGYLTISLTHPKEISKMKMGKRYKQGEVLCTEGKTGRATGYHIHLEVARGKMAGWSLKRKGNYNEYVILNGVKPEEYLFLREKCLVKQTVYKGKKYNFFKESALTYIVKGVPSEPLYIHNKANFRADSVIKRKGLKNGDEVIYFYQKGQLAYIYHYETLGFVALKYLKRKNL